MFGNLSEKQRVIKNLIAFNVSFMLVYSAMNGIVSVQSSLNKEKDLGIKSLTIVFATQLITCLVFPQVIIELLGFKWSMILSEIFSSIYVAANAHPRTYTLLPGSAFNGLSQSIGWTALGMYNQILSGNYAKLTKSSFISVQTLFYAVFGALFQSSYFVGSILIALILKREGNANKMLSSNSTNNSILDQFNYQLYCGVNNCPAHSLPPSSTKPTTMSVYILCAALVFLCVLAILCTLFFVDNVTLIVDDPEKVKKQKTKITCSIVGSRFKTELINLFKLFTYLDFYLLIPFAISTGYERTYFWSEFNRAYVTCLVNVNFIGWTNMLFGLSGAIFSFSTGYVGKYTTQVPILILAIAISVALSVFVLVWNPMPNDLLPICLLALSLSFTRAITTGQVRGLYGLQFRTNSSAFGAATLFTNLGFVGGFVGSLFLCTRGKTYLNLIISIVTFFTYSALVIRNNYKQQKQEQLVKSTEIATKEVTEKEVFLKDKTMEKE